MPRQYTPDPVVEDPNSWKDAPPPTPHQSKWDKFVHKFKEEPLVPLGCFATVAALLGASSALQKGNRNQFNKMLRLRVAAQGVTVIAALGGSLYYQSERRAERDRVAAAKADAAAAATATTTSEVSAQP
ncbi:hypoxia induced protein conserved region-domain-containing protein [Rhodotorula diobovata]|uniref:Hypoxia induced protein conserved region-domain-containing protein n=1 Tax=Rhodotorula diobovata TaxID=5288 RepID=A0A5C5G4Z8_9BASI|nr:hypoxia induced protein conserved region-domain-containing protein [Rhodotorula diobovata]